MFSNIGKKIQDLAEVVCWLGISASLILSFASLTSSIVAFVLTLLIGFLISWVGSF